MYVVLFTAVLISLSAREVSADDSLEQAIRWNSLKDISDDPGKGSFTNCGTAKNFSFTWTPAEPSPRGSLSAELYFIAPYDWASGSGVLDVYLKEMPQTPIIQINQDMSCADVTKVLPQCPCPMKAGKLVHLKYTAAKLPAIPSGAYQIKAQLINSDKKQVLCAKADVTVQL